MPSALDSREYKFMLQAPRFAGAEANSLRRWERTGRTSATPSPPPG